MLLLMCENLTVATFHLQLTLTHINRPKSETTTTTKTKTKRTQALKLSQIRLKTKPNIQIEFGYLPSFPWNSMFALWSKPYNICLIMSATNSIGSHKVSHSNDYPLTPPKANSRLADRQTDWLTEGKTERQFCCQCNFPIKWIWVLNYWPKDTKCQGSSCLSTKDFFDEDFI